MAWVITAARPPSTSRYSSSVSRSLPLPRPLHTQLNPIPHSFKVAVPHSLTLIPDIVLYLPLHPVPRSFKPCPLCPTKVRLYFYSLLPQLILNPIPHSISRPSYTRTFNPNPHHLSHFRPNMPLSFRQFSSRTRPTSPTTACLLSYLLAPPRYDSLHEVLPRPTRY